MLGVFTTRYGKYSKLLWRTFLHYTNLQPLQRGGEVPDPVWVGSKWLLDFPRFPVPPGTSFIFSLCCPMNHRRRAAHSFLEIGRLFSLFSCPTLAHLRLLLLLMSGNVYPNPGPTFPCSMCAGNVTWRGKSVQCCTCSKWVHLRCSQLSLSKFRALDSSHSWSFLLCCVPTRSTVTLSSDSSNMYTSTVQSSPSPATAALLPHPRFQTSYPPSAHHVSSPSPQSPAPGCPSTPPASFYP